MKIRYLFFVILLINAELYAKKSDKANRIENNIDSTIQHRRNSKKNNTFCSLTVKECLNAGQLNICGNSTLNTLSVSGGTILNTLNVNGTSNLSNLNVTGTETVTGTLNVNGQLFLNGTALTTVPTTTTPNAIVLFGNNNGTSLIQSPAPVTIDPSNNINAVHNITMTGNLNMVATPADLSVGVITKGDQRFIYDLGDSTCTFVGVNSGLASANSFSNTGIGFEALGSLASGSFNTAVGREAMHLGASGSFNTSLGALSLIQATGSFNTALGYNTMQGLAGNGNVAVGAAALQTTTGSDNTAVGFGAGNSVFGLTGSNNIYIGANVGPAIAAEANTIRLGTGGQTACFIAGILNTTIGVSGVPVLIDNTGQLGTVSSSARYKYDITDMGNCTSNLVNLRPVTFKYKPEIRKSNQLEYGLIAEEVAEVYPELVVYNKDNEPESVKYHVLNVMLLNEVNKLVKKQQEQDKIIKELQDCIAKLER